MNERFEMYKAAVDGALLGNPLLAGSRLATEADSVPPAQGEIPEPLKSAMAYSLDLPGKRLRPVLLLAGYHLLMEDWRSALPFACALEMIHTYSLIHDDLPALDNDPLRRGKPSSHMVFGENMAILAGDGLLSLAYETMLESPISRERPARALDAIREIALRSGTRGMIAGQTLDVKLEGTQPSAELVRYIHLHKTADLLTAPLTAGLMLAGAGERELSAAREYGKNLGLAFQIVDDLLDETGDAGQMGKQTGMDAQRGKMTWPCVFGAARAREDAAAAVDAAAASLSVFSEKGDFLADLAKQTLVRVK